jgi:hypothetical protein
MGHNRSARCTTHHIPARTVAFSLPDSNAIGAAAYSGQMTLEDVRPALRMLAAHLRSTLAVQKVRG